MKKLKLLFASLALLVGSGTTWAQTDVTSTYITNASFETDGYKAESGNSDYVTGWTFTKDADKTVVGVGPNASGDFGWIKKTVSATDGSYFVGIRHRWESSNARTSTLVQEITIPKGKYTLTADYQFYRKDNNDSRFQMSVEANGGALATVSGTALQKNNTTFDDAIDKNMSLDFEAFTTTNTIKFYVNAKQSTQIAIDNLHLLYNGNYTSELASAIARAQLLYTRTKDADLNTAISQAQGVLEGVDNTIEYQTTIDDEVTTLRTAISTAYTSVTFLTGEDVSFLLENANFESGSAVAGGICTYDYDCTANNTYASQMLAVEGWTIPANGNGKAAGVLSFGSDAFLGGTGYKPTSVASPTSETKALGVLAVWSATAQYKQDVTLPAGRYVIEVPVYNLVGGTTDFTKNLIGFVENEGTEHLATAKTYTVDSWTTERIEFDLNSDVSGYMSLGYQAANKGSGDMPHLLIDKVKITFTDAANAYAATVASATETYNDVSYVNVVGTERTYLKNLIDADASSYSVAQYFTAIDNINLATSAFTAAKANYDALAAKRTDATTNYTTALWPYASTAKKTALDNAVAAVPTDAADAVTKTDAITTAIRQFVESNGLAEGVAVAVNVNSLIEGADPDVNTGWTNGIGVDNRDNEKYTKGDGTKSGKYYDGGWSTSAVANITMTRTFTLPAGQYMLQVTARGSEKLKEYTMSVGEESVNLPKQGSGEDVGTFGHGWSDCFVVFESEGAEQTLTIRAYSEGEDYLQWISFNRLRLTKLDATLATAEDYSNLNAAITAAEGKTLGFETGEYAPYNNIDALEKLAAAKAIDQTANNVQSDVQDATTALTGATWTANTTDVDIVYNGMFSSVADGGLTGWTSASGWGQQQTGVSGDFATAYYHHPGSLQYGNQGVYTMPLAANTIYTLTMSFRSHEENSNNAMYVSVLNESDEGLARVNLGYNKSKSNWKTVSKVFKTGAAGNYVLTLENDGNTWMTNVSIVKGSTVTEPVAVTDAGYATYVSDNDLDYSSVSGLTAYRATISDKTITFNKVTTVPAGEGVLLKGAEDNYTVPVTAGVAAWDADFNAFIRGTGAAVASEADGKYNYILNNVGGVVGFYKANDKKVGTNRAYIQAPVSASRLNFVFDDEEEVTGIKTINAVKNGEAIYNLNGQRVNKAKNGLYILNGRKVMFK